MATVVITGANRGIGLAFAHAFSGRGDAVVGTARDPSAASELASIAEVFALDVSDEASVAALGAQLAGRPIDLLINNAGVLNGGDLSESIDSIRVQFEINALGPILVTRTLLPNLRAAPSARVVNMTSRMGSIDDNTSGRMYGYRMSKAALNMATKSMSHDLAPIPVLALHPGYVRTNMTGGRGDVDAKVAVERMLMIIDRLDSSMTGTLRHRDDHSLPW